MLKIDLNYRYRAVQLLTMYWFISVRRRNFRRATFMFFMSSYLFCPEWFNSVLSTDLNGNEAKIKSVENLVQDLKIEALFKDEKKSNN